MILIKKLKGILERFNLLLKWYYQHNQTAFYFYKELCGFLLCLAGKIYYNNKNLKIPVQFYEKN